MKNIVFLLLLLTSHCGATIRTSMFEMRKSSGVIYYYELPAPFSSFSISSDGSLFGELNSMQNKRYPKGFANKDGIKAMKSTDLLKGIRLGNATLDELLQMKEAGLNTEVPLELLHPASTRDRPSIGQMSYGFVDKAIYKENPSSYIALVYLELSLIYRKNGAKAKAIELLEDASKVLDLEKLKFPNDSKLRMKVSDSNFGRPESAIMYLRAQIAFEKSKFEEASRITELLVANNPSDPYTWQAVIEFGHLSESESQLVERLLDAYPVVMGARHLTFDFRMFEGDKGPVSKESFSAWLPGWIKEERKKIIKEKGVATKWTDVNKPPEKEAKQLSKWFFLLLGVVVLVTIFYRFYFRKSGSLE